MAKRLLTFNPGFQLSGVAFFAARMHAQMPFSVSLVILYLASDLPARACTVHTVLAPLARTPTPFA